MHPTFESLPLARSLIPHAFDRQDGAHDWSHLLRVWRAVERIMEHEGGDHDVLLAATLLHDCIWVDKASPERPFASRLAASKAKSVLSDLGWTTIRTSEVCHAIEAHRFSAKIEPVTLEAKILQDADRLDAMGFIGVARCIYLAGLKGAAIYDAGDPTATARTLDDSAYALDHFQTKLLTLGEGFQTETGRSLAAERAARLQSFYSGLLSEIL